MRTEKSRKKLSDWRLFYFIPMINEPNARMQAFPHLEMAQGSGTLQQAVWGYLTK